MASESRHTQPISTLCVHAQFRYPDIERSLQAVLDDEDPSFLSSLGMTRQEVAKTLKDLSEASEKPTLVARLLISRSPGTGIVIRSYPDQHGSQQTNLEAAHEMDDSGDLLDCRGGIISSATARLIQIQDIVELSCLPLGVRFEPPACQHNDCRPHGQTGRCAMVLPDGIKAVFTTGARSAPQTDPQPMAPEHWASTCWRFASPSAGTDIFLGGTIRTPVLQSASHIMRLLDPLLGVSKSAEARDGGPPKRKRTYSARQGDPAINMGPPSSAPASSSAASDPPAARGHSRSSSFRQDLLGQRRRGHQLVCMLSQQGDIDCLDAAHILPSALDSNLVDLAMASLFAQTWTSASRDSQCLPIFSSSLTWTPGDKETKDNGLLLDSTIHRCFDKNDTFLLLHGSVLVIGLRIGSLVARCRQPRCPSLICEDDTDRLQELQEAYEPKWAHRSGLTSRKCAALHVKSLLTFFKTFMLDGTDCRPLLTQLHSGLRISRALSNSQSDPQPTRTRSSPWPSSEPSSEAGKRQEERYPRDGNEQRPPPSGPGRSSSPFPFWRHDMEQGDLRGQQRTRAFSSSSSQDPDRTPWTPETSPAKPWGSNFKVGQEAGMSSPLSKVRRADATMTEDVDMREEDGSSTSGYSSDVDVDPDMERLALDEWLLGLVALHGWHL